MEFTHINDYLIDREIEYHLEWPFDREITINNQRYHKVYYKLNCLDHNTFDDLVNALIMDCNTLDFLITRTNASVTVAFKSGVWKFHFISEFKKE